MVRLNGLGAALLISCSLVSAPPAAAETSVSVTVNAANGIHTDRGIDLQGHGVIPLFKVERRYKRAGAFVEFAPTGYGRYLGAPRGGPDTSSVSYWSAGARWYAPADRFFVGAGVTDVNQQTNYLPSSYFVAPPLTRVNTTETRRWRSASFLYEAGATLWQRAASGVTVRVAVNPAIRTRLFVRELETETTLDSSGNPTSFSAIDSERSVPVHGSQFDAALALTTKHKSSAWSYGVRFLNYRLFYGYGGIADKDVFVMPFIGFSQRIGH